MQITKENTGNLTATIKIELEPADYQEKVNTQLKDYQHKANMPGFRPGKVPYGLIKKMYGKAVLMDELNKVYSEGLYNYLVENNINTMAHPMPSDKSNQPIDLDQDTNYTFYFDIALAPEFDLDISDNINVDYYKVAVNEETVEKYVAEILKRNGPVEDVDTIGENDMVSGQFIELDENGNPKEDGIKNDAYIYMEQLNDEASKKKLIGLKVDDSVEIEPKKMARNDYEEAYFLGLKKEQLADVTSKFQFHIKKITRTGLAELNEELFKKVLPNHVIETEEQFREAVHKELEYGYAKESETKFMNDVVAKLQENHDFELPDEFLKRYMLQSQEDGKLNAENIDAEYESQKKLLKWQLIENKLIKEFGLDVSHEDVKEFVKGYFRQSVKSMSHDHDHEHDHEHEHEHNHDHEHDHSDDHKKEMDDARLNQIADMVLKNEEEAKRIKDTIFDQRMRDLFKSKVKSKEVETTYDEFVKLISTQNN